MTDSVILTATPGQAAVAPGEPVGVRLAVVGPAPLAVHAPAALVAGADWRELRRGEPQLTELPGGSVEWSLEVELLALDPSEAATVTWNPVGVTAGGGRIPEPRLFPAVTVAVRPTLTADPVGLRPLARPEPPPGATAGPHPEIAATIGVVTAILLALVVRRRLRRNKGPRPELDITRLSDRELAAELSLTLRRWAGEPGWTTEEWCGHARAHDRHHRLCHLLVWCDRIRFARHPCPPGERGRLIQQIEDYLESRDVS